MVHGLGALRILECPVDLGAATFDLEVLVLPGGKVPTDLSQTALQLLLKP